MKKVVGILLAASIVFSACSSSKPYYKTAEGKRKQKYYNDIQFGGKSAATMKKKF
jgi:predicted component of type VI protein secretion system